MPTFEESLKKLETIVDQLEKGDLPLEQSLQLFEEGVGLSAVCKKELDAAEGKVQMLIKQRDGSLKTEPSLAKSWSVSRDGRQYTLQLRHGVRFSSADVQSSPPPCRWSCSSQAPPSSEIRSLARSTLVSSLSIIGPGCRLDRYCCACRDGGDTNARDADG